MSERYKIYTGGLFFITLTVVGCIDVFTRREYADEVVKNLNHCIRHKGLKLYSFCLMPSHLHIICSADEGNLCSILRDFKSYTAKQIIKQITENQQESRKEWLLYLFRYFSKVNKHNKEFQFWQQHNHPIDLVNAALLHEKQEYIHTNPVVAGIVTEPQYYTFSSANWECGLELAEFKAARGRIIVDTSEDARAIDSNIIQK